MTLPPAYEDLSGEGAPRMLVEGLKEFGVTEKPGSLNEQKILDWANEVGLANVYRADSVPWCGLFMAVVAQRAGKKLVVDPLWALNWAKFGVEPAGPATAILGDVLTFKRPGGGHVALYVGEDEACYHVLGGNQSDRVSITRIERERLWRVRRPVYALRPGNCRAIQRSATGTISKNEG